MKLGYKSFYLYSAVSAVNGDDFTLMISHVNQECMQLYLDEFAKTLKEDIILVMDNAGWHKGLIIPANIEIIFLPPYSPELNPVERLWLYIKSNILKNQIYDDLLQLEIAVTKFLNTTPKSVIQQICKCLYVTL